MKGALYSCFKRWRSKEISCNDSACTGSSCMRSDVFYASYTLQPWDIGELKGPFPRTEPMCVITRSSCAPTDTNCISAVTIEQISCDDPACTSGLCTRSTVLVDKDDIIVSASTVTTSGSETQKEEEEKRQEEVKKAEEQAKEEAQKQQENTGSNTGTSNTDIRTQPALGCFDAQGIWTTDRTKCATNQQPYVEPQASTQSGQGSTEKPEERTKAEKEIEDKFVPETRRTALVQNLLSSTTEAVGRIDRLLENPTLPPDAREELQKTQEVLRTVQRTVSDEQTVKDLQGLADTASKGLESVQETAERLGTTAITPPTTVLSRLERILAGLPSIFGLLLNEGVPVDSMIIDGYLSAQSVYDRVQPACVQQPDTCSDLSQVIDALEPVFAGLRLSLETSGRSDLEVQIEALLQ